MQIEDKEGICFDDVLIKPDYSAMSSRFDVDTSRIYKGKTLCPIIAANMSSIATVEMQNALACLQVVVPFHRFQSIESELECLEKADPWLKAASIGLHDRIRTQAVAEYADWLFLELAHAFTTDCIEEVQWINQTFPEKVLVVGNVATPQACSRLCNAGADLVKVGIGSGSVCTTRLVTGVGVPQLTAIDECSGYSIIADGGIRTSGDILKALAAGSTFVMVGSLLAGTDETPSPNECKQYCGMASKEAQVDRYGKLPSGIVPEGISVSVPYRGPAKKVISDLLAGLRQGMSMIGAKDLKELRPKAVFQRVSQATLLENQPHIKRRI